MRYIYAQVIIWGWRGTDLGNVVVILVQPLADWTLALYSDNSARERMEPRIIVALSRQ